MRGFMGLFIWLSEILLISIQLAGKRHFISLGNRLLIVVEGISRPAAEVKISMGAPFQTIIFRDLLN
jgi:hypothetical protein